MSCCFCLFQTLLDLGASPNYKDIRGLSPLYHCVCHDTSAHCVELLLHDHSVIGVVDERGWCEVHQVSNQVDSEVIFKEVKIVLCLPVWNHLFFHQVAPHVGVNRSPYFWWYACVCNTLKRYRYCLDHHICVIVQPG